MQKHQLTYDVIIAAFNSEAYIGEAIRSVLSSSRQPYRIIVVDDDSEDQTVEVASSFGGVEVLQNPENQERSRTRNRGIRESNADFIQFLDADDLLHPDKTAIQLDFLENNPQIDVAFGDVWLFSDGEWPGEKRIYPNKFDVTEQLIRKNILALHSLLFRRSFFERFGYFDSSLPISEDRELYLRSMISGAKWHYTNGAEVYYRQHEGGTIRSRQYESAYYNAVPVRKHRRELAGLSHGRYKQVIADSLRTLARNANIAGRPMSEVITLIDEATEICDTPQITQNRWYQLFEYVFGPKSLERLLRLRFRFGR